MTIRVYNTLTRAKEPFEPMIPGKVRMYVCGPTVYDSCHIGHARSVVVFDMIFRYLIACAYEVTYVRNFTDIDDKIINRANELGMTTEALAEKYIIEFHEDMDALNNLRPTIEPKATEHIPQIIAVIQRLFEILERVFLLKMMAVDHVPIAAQLHRQTVQLGPFQRRNPALARNAFLLRQFAHDWLLSKLKFARFGQQSDSVENLPHTRLR